MALAIATNNAAIQSAAAASSVNRDMETSMARLSTGKRINSARDDAAGVAIASRLSSEIRGTDQAIRNSVDGQALIDTAEGGHKEIENILQRMREISVQSANDTNNTDDRANLQSEMTALITEIDRIASVTTWAGQSMMDSEGSTFKFQVGTATGDKNQISVSIKAMAAEALGLAHAGSAALSDVSFPVNPASEVTAVAEVLAVSYVAPVAEVLAVSYVAPVTAVTEVTAVSYVAPVTGVTAVTEVSTTAEVLQGKLSGGAKSGFLSLNNGLLTGTLQIHDQGSSGPKTYQNVAIDLDPTVDANVTVGNFNTAAIAAGSSMRATISDAAATDGQILITESGPETYTGDGVKFATDAANTTAALTITVAANKGSITFNAANGLADLTFPKSNPAVNDETPFAVVNLSNAPGGLATAVIAINAGSSTHGITAFTETNASGEAELRIMKNADLGTGFTAAQKNPGSKQLDLADLTINRTGNDLITTAAVTAVTAVTEVTAVSYVAPVTGVTEVTAVSYVAPVAEVLAVSYVAPVTAVAASPDGSMTAVTGSRAATDGIFTATAGRTPVTITLKGTTITVSPLNGDNGSADAAKIANEINTGTATHTYKAKANDDGTVTIIAPPGATSVTTFENSRLAVKAIDGAIKAVNTQRSSLGAISNRLSHTVNNLTNISSNLSAAKGGIEDADFAFETTELAKNQILQQASTAMLAQGNASKQNVLSLLQG